LGSVGFQETVYGDVSELLNLLYVGQTDFAEVDNPELASEHFFDRQGTRSQCFGHLLARKEFAAQIIHDVLRWARLRQLKYLF